MPQSPFVKLVNGRPVIDPGALRHQITLLEQTIPDASNQDASGIVQAWTPAKTARAAISVSRGKEMFSAGQASAEVFLIVAMWWQSGVLPSQQVQAQNGTYVITAVENVLEMNLVLELICIAVGANQ